jgi:hypothetical protein
MVIHDLKHPTEATLHQLSLLSDEVRQHKVFIKAQGQQIKSLLRKIHLLEIDRFPPPLF